MCDNLSSGIMVYNAEKSNEVKLFPLLRLFQFSREFRIGSLFWVVKKELKSKKKYILLS